MYRLILILFFLSNLSEANAQLILRFAEYNYRTLNYPDAIPFYKYHVTKKDTNNVVAIRNLAECYRLTNQYQNAEEEYGKLIRKDSLWNDKVFYADALLRNKKYIELDSFLISLQSYKIYDERIIEITNTLKNRNLLMYSDTQNVIINRLGFNSDISDFAPTIYKDKLIFASSRQVRPFIQRNHTWTEANFISLQESSVDDDYQTLKPFALELKNKLNYGPASFLVKDSTMYYTVNNPKIKSKKDGYINLRIQSAEFIYGKWRAVEKFPFNSVEYACAHPNVSSDGRYLYFSSNKPGGYGGMDIYVCEWSNDSAWSAPRNLGQNINTKGEELFPFISKDNVLYFSSNGKSGLGGLDIFSVDLSKRNDESRNLGAPINSSDDDFGIVVRANSNKGFFSSDRGNKGIDDDIYSFEIIAKNIKVRVVDSISKQIINPANISIANAEYVKNCTLNNEDYILRINPDQLFHFTASAQNYKSKKTSRRFSLEDSVFIIELSKNLMSCNVQGVISKKNSDEKLDSVLVKIYDFRSNELKYNYYTTSSGFYKLHNLQSNTRYAIMVSKQGYFSKEITFTTSDSECKRAGETDYDYVKNIELEEIVIGKAIKIDNIYFDLGKWNIRPDAAIELDKIVKMMNDNPEIVIELSSHTDSRASSIFNETLSDKRAKSSANYIISKGIDANRITGKGYGEYQLINRCADGVKCSEKEHQQNRRTEFKVVGFL